jgi:hypothetical protein
MRSVFARVKLGKQLSERQPKPIASDKKSG